MEASFESMTETSSSDKAYEALYQIFKAKGGEIPLLQACRVGNIGLVDYIAKNHGHSPEDTYQIGDDGFSPLYFAIRENNFALATLFTLFFLPFRYESQHDRDLIALARKSDHPEMPMILNIIITSMSKGHLKQKIEEKDKKEASEQAMKELIAEEDRKQKQRDKKKQQKARAKVRKQTEASISTSQPVSLETPDFNKFGSDKPIRKQIVEESVFTPFIKISRRSNASRKRLFKNMKKINEMKKKIRKWITTRVSTRRFHAVPSLQMSTIEELYRIEEEVEPFSLPHLVVSNQQPLLGWPLYEQRWKERNEKPFVWPLALGLSQDSGSIFTHRIDHSLGMFQPSIFF
jgi:hypothetical protein